MLTIEQLIADTPAGSVDDDVLLELIALEHRLRLALKLDASTEHYCARFPLLAERIPKLFPLGDRVNEPSDTRVLDRSEVDQHLTRLPSVSTKCSDSQTSPLHHLTDATLQIGKYRLRDCLGQGGMGTVYRAEHTLIDHQVAIASFKELGGTAPSFQTECLP